MIAMGRLIASVSSFAAGPVPDWFFESNQVKLISVGQWVWPETLMAMASLICACNSWLFVKAFERLKILGENHLKTLYMNERVSQIPSRTLLKYTRHKERHPIGSPTIISVLSLLNRKLSNVNGLKRSLMLQITPKASSSPGWVMNSVPPSTRF